MLQLKLTLLMCVADVRLC